MKRRVKVTVKNSTEHTMHVKRKELEHGKWTKKPENIGPRESEEFIADKTTGSAYGVKGFVQYECNGGLFVIEFVKPYGPNPSSITVPEEDMHNVEVEVYGIKHTTEEISGTVELIKVLEEKPVSL